MLTNDHPQVPDTNGLGQTLDAASTTQPRAWAPKAPPLKLRTVTLMLSLAVAAVTSMLTVVAVARQRTAMLQLLDQPNSESTRILTDADHLLVIARGLSWVTMFLVGGCLSAWIHRALTIRQYQQANVKTPASGAWSPFIPVANIVLPWLAMREIRNARHRQPSTGGMGDPVVFAWWGMFVFGWVATGWLSRSWSTTGSGITLILTISVAGAIALVVAAVLGIIGVHRLRIDVEKGLPEQAPPPTAAAMPVDVAPPVADTPTSDPPTSDTDSSSARGDSFTSTRSSLVLGGGALLLAAAAAVIAAGGVEKAEATVVTAGGNTPSIESETILLTGLVAPDCLSPEADLTGEILALPIVPCTEPHTIEFYGMAHLPELGSDYPTFDTLDRESVLACADLVYAQTGQRFGEIAYFPMTLLPTQTGWAIGDRSVHCFAEAVDETTFAMSREQNLLISSERQLANQFGLKVGQCANGSEAVLWFEHVPCDQAHQFEMIHVDGVNESTSRSHPGDAELFDELLEVCTGAVFTDYVGVEFDDSEFDVIPLFTEIELSELLDHVHTGCVIDTFEPVTGSVAGSNR
ncbi:MAG: DUF4328 domain-containing protein [Actinomycetia bacterium]|nr:DUF4328 domain-containing protein [Actinomycetes bacterium]